MNLSYAILLGLSGVSAIALSTQAQITIDGTTNTILDNNGNSIIINGGDRAGDNLFHSFQEFSVINGNEAYFNNAAEISNIFSRVTGGNISNIDGLLRANGGANLFIINPAGIIFGEGASLDIGGSFFATTADSIIFSDSIEFSAIDSENPPLLTINQPVGLVLGNNPGAIVNQSVADDVGLQVSPGNNLTLVGGDIEFNSGIIFAPGANIELRGLSAAGEISINADGSLNFPEDIARADVTLTNGTDINVQAEGGGNITVNANNIELSGGEFGFSSLLAGIAPDSASPDAQAGDITLNATGDINITQGSIVSNNVEEFGIGNSGNIDINATNLNLTEGSYISVDIFGTGNGGKITIKASDTILVDGEDSTGYPSFITSDILDTGVGNTEGIEITTGKLFLTRGTIVGASIWGVGDAGEVTINAADTVSVDGEDSSGFPSNIGSNVEAGEGNVGRIEINTANLSLTRGGFLSSTTFAAGNAKGIRINATHTIYISGEDSTGFTSGIDNQVDTEDGKGSVDGMEINTTHLLLRDGGEITASTFGGGNAGTITIDAADTISIDGQSSSGNTSGIFSSAVEGEGNAADIRIVTNNLSVTNNGQIAVDSIGQGSAGNLLIVAKSLILENGASFLASTTVGTGGSITLDIADNIILRNGSLISANALNDANGGNVIIDADSIVAFPNQDNDIIAAAEQGIGGEIDITTSAIFGIAEGDSTITNLTNDLDASSEFGIDGTISINQLDVNPAEGLEELPTEVIDVASLVAQNLCQQGEGSEFILTGKGGIASSPSQTRDSNLSQVDLVEPVLEEAGEQSFGFAQDTESREAEKEIVEAQGWVVNSRGTLELVAYSTDAVGSPPQLKYDKICP